MFLFFLFFTSEASLILLRGSAFDRTLACRVERMYVCVSGAQLTANRNKTEEIKYPTTKPPKKCVFLCSFCSCSADAVRMRCGTNATAFARVLPATAVVLARLAVSNSATHIVDDSFNVITLFTTSSRF